MIMDSRTTDASHASELSEAANAASWLEDTIEDVPIPEKNSTDAVQ